MSDKNSPSAGDKSDVSAAAGTHEELPPDESADCCTDPDHREETASDSAEAAPDDLQLPGAAALSDEEPLEESEPYLGPAWAIVMLILYLLKEAFPAEQYSLLWWFQIYIIGLVMAITVFTLIKRRQFYNSERRRAEQRRGTAPNGS